LPAGRPTGAQVCASRHRSQSAAQSAPVYCGPRSVRSSRSSGTFAGDPNAATSFASTEARTAGPCWSFGDLDDGGAVAAVDGRHQSDDAVTLRPHGGEVSRDAPVRLGHRDLAAGGLARFAVARENEIVGAHDGVDATTGDLEPLSPQRRPTLRTPHAVAVSRSSTSRMRCSTTSALVCRGPRGRAMTLPSSSGTTSPRCRRASA
jgi:hypothetical protein